MDPSGDLFIEAGDAPVRLALPGADVVYHARLDDWPRAPDVLLRDLIEQIPWRQQTIRIAGQARLQPRLTAWYGDAGTRYTYSGLTLDPAPWTPLLEQIRATVQARSGHVFNSVLLNHYRDERDAMGMHSDNEPELGEQPVIASVSFGAVRTLVFQPRKDRVANAGAFRLPLASGSLLLMAGDTQHNWKHGVDRERAPCGPRVNLTFRRIFARS
ncbi:MAG: alpha-ketoglutarate-dependent dioxygenase AlkB [Panacagrimonas sp.]|jgi:alkylated DNA repair dioxygenase AlkB|nr:alpha-ketoglutarate-dependent dioxygenase AlkB [Panacagrimonas sp.]MCC2655926.1 alpha-ketoglutarate-dependent dioxygenase AlkB [Panacagrimonas sp.]